MTVDANPLVTGTAPEGTTHTFWATLSEMRFQSIGRSSRTQAQGPYQDVSHFPEDLGVPTMI